MQEKIVITNRINEKCVIDKHLLFKWTCVERKEERNRITFKFQRDEYMPHLKEIEKMEYEYVDYTIGSMLPTYIFPAIAMVLLTVFLIIFLTRKETFQFMVFFLSLMIPSLICLLLGFFFMFSRVSAIKRIEKEKPLKDAEYKAKIDALS